MKIMEGQIHSVCLGSQLPHIYKNVDTSIVGIMHMYIELNMKHMLIVTVMLMVYHVQFVMTRNVLWSRCMLPTK